MWSIRIERIFLVTDQEPGKRNRFHTLHFGMISEPVTNNYCSSPMNRLHSTQQ